MESHIFYCNSDIEKNAIPIKFISEEFCEEFLARSKTIISNQLKAQDFAGKLGNTGIITNAEGNFTECYIGLGSKTDKQAVALAKALTNLPCNTYEINADNIDYDTYLIWALAQYKFDFYKTYQNKPKLLVLPNDIKNLILAETSSIFFIRDLINQPANMCMPDDLFKVAAKLAKEYSLEIKEWVGEELLEHNFHGIHAVGKASDVPPRLIKLTYGNPKHPAVTLIGKGVTFDTGGLGIKPASNMRLMKKDMAGAAHILGLAKFLVMLKCPIYLTVLVPAAENAIGSRAFRPGDIITMHNGLRVEIDHTDAEGRLIVGDALSYASESNPEIIIDFTTLTGSARAAVGTEIAALFSNDNNLAKELIESGLENNDIIWQLPLFKNYERMLNSNAADLLNASPSPYAGAIIAALFLQRFIKPEISWAHFDIMAWNISSEPGKPEGGEAMAFRAVGNYLLNRFNSPHPPCYARRPLPQGER